MQTEKEEIKELYVGHQTKEEYNLVVAKNRAWWIEHCKKHEGAKSIGSLLDSNDKFGTRLYSKDVLKRLQDG